MLIYGWPFTKSCNYGLPLRLFRCLIKSRPGRLRVVTTARLPHSDSTGPGSSDRLPHSESAGLDCPTQSESAGLVGLPTPTSRDCRRPGPAGGSASRLGESLSHRDRNPGIDSAAPLRVDRARLRLLRHGDSAHCGRATPRRPGPVAHRGTPSPESAGPVRRAL